MLILHEKKYETRFINIHCYKFDNLSVLYYFFKNGIIMKKFIISIFLLLSQTVMAQNADYVGTTIDKIRQTGKIVIGHRTSSIPISYYDDGKNPIGYGVDICLGFVDRLKFLLNMPKLETQFLEVTGETRISYVRQGLVDIECGSTTNNMERRQQVDFSIPYYIAGVRMMTKNPQIASLSDLRGKKIGLTKGTTSVKIMDNINKERVMSFNFVQEKDFTSTFNLLATGQVDAFILDDLLLFGERSKSENPSQFYVLGEFLSIEPLAIMMRKDDPQFKAVLNKYMVDIMSSGLIQQYYNKWFMSPIPPKNQTLNIPPSYLLKDIFRMPVDITGN